MIGEDVRVASLTRLAAMSGIRNVLNTYKEGCKVKVLCGSMRDKISAATHLAVAEHAFTAACLASRVRG